MENAAMAAYLKDVESNNVDFSAESIMREKSNKLDKNESVANPNQMPSATAETIPRNTKNRDYRDHPPNVDYCDPYAGAKRSHQQPKHSSQIGPTSSGRQSGENKTQGKGSKTARDKRKGKQEQEEESTSKPPLQKLWYEALTSEGYTYYWHIETNESVWEPPAEGYMTIAEQENEAKEEATQLELFKQIDEEGAKERAERLEEQRANAEREKLRERKKRHAERKKDTEKDIENSVAPRPLEKVNSDNEDSKEEEAIPYRRDYSLPEKTGPFGPWRTVKTIPAQTVDLQLPAKKSPVTAPTIQNPKTVTRIFTEKTVTQLSSGDSDDDRAPVTFKKRKFGKKNVRQRLNDD